MRRLQRSGCDARGIMALQGGHRGAYVAVRGEQRRMQEVDAADAARALLGPQPVLVVREELRDHVQQVLLLCTRGTNSFVLRCS
jgi:hypothetical protein